MSARDEFSLAQIDAGFAEIELAAYERMCAEIDRLRNWQRESIMALERWDEVYDQLPDYDKGRLGEFKSDAVLRFIQGEIGVIRD